MTDKCWRDGESQVLRLRRHGAEEGLTVQIYEKINLELRLYTSNSEGETKFGGTNEEVQVSGWEKVNLQTRGLHKDPFWGFSGVRGLILTFSIFLLPPLFFFLLYFCVRLCIHSKMHLHTIKRVEQELLECRIVQCSTLEEHFTEWQVRFYHWIHRFSKIIKRIFT